MSWKRVIGIVFIGWAVFCLPFASRGQEAKLNGFVTDGATGRALAGANVLLRHEGGGTKGTATGEQGAFILTDITPGRYELRISFIGYATYTDTLFFSADAFHTINAALKPTNEALQEITVEEEGRAGAARITAGHQRIAPEDIRRVPTPDVSGDLVSYLKTQPAVVAIGDQGGKVFIRGGEPSQNRIFLDEMPVYQPFHVLGFYSAFPSQIISHADVYAGGYGAEYNGGLSAVIGVSSRVGNKKEHAAAATVSPFTSSAFLEGPIAGGFSFLSTFRSSLLEQGAGRYVNQPLPFVFQDGFAKIHGPLGRTGRVSVRHLQTYDRGQLGKDIGESPHKEIRWTNRATGLRYLMLPSWLPVRAVFHVSHSYLRSEVGDAQEPVRQSQVQTTRVGLSANFPGDWLSVNSGWSIDITEVTSKLGGLYQNVFIGRSPELHQAAGYLVPEVQLTSRLRVQLGLRAQFYYVRFDPYLEPRLRVVWDLGIHHLSAAGGFYQQEVVGLSDRRDAANVFTAWTYTPNPNSSEERVRGDVRTGRLGKAWHGLLGYRIHPAPWLEASVEGYYKELTNLYIAEWTAYPRFTTRLQPADGRSYGMEARLELTKGPFYGYLNYGLSFTRYQARQAQLGIWYGTEEMSFRPPHDRRHQVNLLATAELLGFDISAKWAFGSSRPFSRAIGFDGFRLIYDVIDPTKIPGSRRVIYERPFSGLLPTYHRLDIAVRRSFSLRQATLTLQASVMNAYNRRNIFYLDVFTHQRADQLPLVPALGMKLEFK